MPGLTIDVDARAILTALAQLGAQAQGVVNTVSEGTAQRIATEAKARIARRTGKTAEAITVEPARNGNGSVVLIGVDRARIGHWLEFGTRTMTRRPFFFPSARLEEQPHHRRLAEALQVAIDAQGLGA